MTKRFLQYDPGLCGVNGKLVFRKIVSHNAEEAWSHCEVVNEIGLNTGFLSESSNSLTLFLVCFRIINIAYLVEKVFSKGFPFFRIGFSATREFVYIIQQVLPEFIIGQCRSSHSYNLKMIGHPVVDVQIIECRN